MDELLRVIPIDARDGLPRGATRPTTLSGVPIAEGATVLVSKKAANWDPEAFPDAETVNLRRTPNQHLSFGWGRHRCPGEHLARMELEEVLRVLVARFPDLRLAVPMEEVRWKASTVPGLEELPVHWSSGDGT